MLMNTDLIITLRTNCVNPLCIYLYSLEAETTSHFFFYCHYYHLIRLTLFINELWEIDMNLPNLSEKKFLNIILYGSSHFSDSQNQSILNSTIKYITDSNHFSGPIFWSGGRYHFYILMVYVCIALGKVFYSYLIHQGLSYCYINDLSETTLTENFIISFCFFKPCLLFLYIQY